MCFKHRTTRNPKLNTNTTCHSATRVVCSHEKCAHLMTLGGKRDEQLSCISTPPTRRPARCPCHLGGPIPGAEADEASVEPDGGAGVNGPAGRPAAPLLINVCFPAFLGTEKHTGEDTLLASPFYFEC